ncbi:MULTISPECIES: hypothetical protein [unclassified Brenneria]|uniref:hypothetical protein n=1 Tax=unclassified Brenneria TaxID=2634434 RepID=UPI0015521DDD|nr:hypothetical protein [Brenneria sp. hezel4-2-4]MEE3649492.1 hypothetical protein [Brenneria sp. HEZEL_4_2_4]NPC99449.1 hypothetical protein [Brenneria sp. hezel4-2-4]
MKKITILIFMSVISGCAGEKIWVNYSKTMQDFYADRATCNSMSQGVSNPQIYTPTTIGPGNFSSGFSQGWNMGSAIGAAAERDRIFSDCMMGYGWVLHDKKTMPPPPSSPPTEPEMPKAVSDALKSVPELNSWHETGSPKFDVAVEVDELLKSNPGWQKAPMDYRFRRSYEVTKALYGDQARAAEQCLVTVVTNANGKLPAQNLAALRMFPDFIVTEKNRACQVRSSSEDYNEFLNAVEAKLPAITPIYKKANKDAAKSYY